jgi:hypothetical protein
MLVEEANTLLQTFRRAVADTCTAKGTFNAHLTGTREEYDAAWQKVSACLLAETQAYIACQDAMMDCGCQEQERGRCEAIGQAHKERALDFMEEEARDATPEG